VTVQTLAIGIEPLDAGRGLRVVQPLDIVFDATVLGLPRPSLERHRSALFALRYQTGVTTPVNLRVTDDYRRFVPRRLSIPILDQLDADAEPQGGRARRPVMFPGAAYDVSDKATGIRGSVVRDGAPMRWARIEARLANTDVVVGRAHGDDRGEFLLLIVPEAVPGAVLPPLLAVDVFVFGPAVQPVPAFPALPTIDPLWDLPVEQAAAPGQPDPVLAGEVLPAGYTASATRTVNLILGRLGSEASDPFDIV
jgi:hypothetical protein